MFARLSTAMLFAIAFAGPSPAAAQSIDLTIDGNEAHARIELVGSVIADLTIRFEKVVGLSAESLGLSVTQVDPLSPNLLGRLPDVTAISIPASFPLMISVEPSTDGGLSFEGMAEIELYTTALHYTPTTPLRLFKSTGGAPFRDITVQNSAGSYRARGNGGEWSDFLIVADTRPLEATIADKFDGLQDTLSAASAAIGDATHSLLQGLLDDASALWMGGDASGAIHKLVEFETEVGAAAEAGEIPAIWRSARDLDNFDGMLRARAATLRFSLGLAG